MFLYSPFLTVVVALSHFISAYRLRRRRVFRRRLHEKFHRGAENQAFLVESVSGDRDAQGDGGRAADAATMGGADSRLT